MGPAGQGAWWAARPAVDPATGGADRRSKPNETSLGASYTLRNAPTVINAAYSPVWQFWDGRADSLWSQALQPPEGTAECAGSRLKVAHVLGENYKEEFRELFGAESLPDSIASMPQDGVPGHNPDLATRPTKDRCTPDDPREPFDDAYDCLSIDDERMVNRAYANFGKAIAAYERKLVATLRIRPFRSVLGRDEEAMSPATVHGAGLYVGRADAPLAMVART